MQQHVKSVHVHSAQTPPPNKRFAGVKATVGNDTLALEHARKCNEHLTATPAPSYRGVRPHVDGEHFMNVASKQASANAREPARAKETLTAGATPHVGTDALLLSHVKEQRLRHARPPSPTARSTPHVGADSLTLEHARALKQHAPPKTGLSFAPFGVLPHPSLARLRPSTWR